MKVLWRRSPFLLLRFPALALAIVAVSAVAAITAVTRPAFLASTEVGSLREGIDQSSVWAAGYIVNFPDFAFVEFFGEGNEITQENIDEAIEQYLTEVHDSERALGKRMAEIEEVGGPFLSVVGSPSVASNGSDESNVRLVHRTDAFDNVTLLEGGEHDGVWIADTTAQKLGVGVGDTIDLESFLGKGKAEVSGIYRYIPSDEPNDFWSTLSELIYRAPGEEQDPPTFILAAGEAFEDLVRSTGDLGVFSLDFPLSDPEIPLVEAEHLVKEFAEVSRELSSPTSEIAQEVGNFVGTFRLGETSTALRGLVTSARERIETVTPVADLLSTAARFVALAVIAAAGFFLVKRRRTEVATLVARGVGPIAQGVRYGVEALIPAIVGTALGSFGGFLLVARLGPAESLPLSVLGGAVPAIAVSLIAALFILMVAAGVAVGREERAVAERLSGVGGLRAIQVGALIALVAGVLAYRNAEEVSAESLTDLRDPNLTIVPVVLLLAGAILVAGLFRAALPRLAGWLRFRVPGLYLSARRLSGASTMTQVLVIAGAWALGIAIYGFTMSASVDASAIAKAKLFLGSDYASLVAAQADVSDLDVPATQVTRFARASLGDGGDVSMLIVDPDTFEGAAYWRDDFAAESLEELIDLIDRPHDRGLILSTIDLGDSPELTSGDASAPLEVAAQVSKFPGMPGTGRMIVMTRDTFTRIIGNVAGATSPRVDEIWAKGSPEDVEAALSKADISIYRGLDAETVLDTPSLQSLLWLLGLLAAMGAAAAIIAILGLLLYLQARQRTAMVSSALTRRMGLKRPAEYASWTGEIAGALLAALIGGVLFGLPVASLMKERLDPRPTLLPGPSLIIPVAMLVGLAVVLIAVAFIAGRRVQRTIDATDVAEVMRT